MPRASRLLPFLLLALLAAALFYPRSSSNGQEPAESLVTPATVIRVIDGDGLAVRLGSGPEEIRLYGIDAPEARAPAGREATRALERLVAGAQVEIEPVAEDRDRYRRVIAIVYADGVNVNERLAAEGHAWAYRRYLGQVPGDAAYCDLEAGARDARRGLWSRPAEQWVPPWIYRERQRAGAGARVPSKDYAGETAADCRAAIGRPEPGAPPDAAPPPPGRDGHPPGCDIKGNINGKGERIYHLPGSPSYADTRISTAKGERWFCSEPEAQAAGWRAARFQR